MSKVSFTRALSSLIVVLLLSTSVVVLTANNVSADISGDFVYRLIDGGTHVEITDYTGAGGAVVIPSTIAALPVTSIGDRAFYNEALVTSVTIPDGVTNIGNQTFMACRFTSLTIPDSVGSIGYGAFRNSHITSISLPDHITVIANETFRNCINLASVTIPDDVTIIQDWAFAYCRNFTSMTIPDNVTYIGNYSFNYCDKLVSVTIPDNVTFIGSFSFYNCDKLISVTIPDKVTSLSSSMFGYCHSLTSVTLPENLTTIGMLVFSNCYALSSVTIPEKVSMIGNSAFRLCRSLTSLSIPSSVLLIGVGVFSECSVLASIDVDATNPNYASSEGVLYTKAMNELVQYPLARTGHFTVPSGVVTIGNQAFDHCINLTSVTLPSGVTVIRNYGFGFCSNLTSMLFLGWSPSCESLWIENHNPDLMVYYLNGSMGFTTPTWNGLNTTCLSVPGSPHNLQVEAGHTVAVLTWEAPSFTGNSTITNYTVYRATDASGPFVLINSTTGLNYTDDGLTNGQTYWYNVTAVNDVGESVPSETVSATPNPYPGVPTLTSAVTGKSNTTLSWTAPDYVGSGPITGYQMFYGTGADDTAWTMFGTVDDLMLSGTVTGLVGGTTYHFGIKAVNADGSSAMSNHLTAVPFDVPGIPTDVLAMPGDTNITLSWDAPANDGGLDIDHYVVYQDDVDVMHVVGTSAIVTGLTNGHEYTFKISAHNSAGYGLSSSEVLSTPITVPGAPVLVSATAGTLNVTLTWTAPTSDGFSPITGYYVFYGTDDVTTQFGSVLSAGTLTVNVTGLSVGTIYHFAVKAVNAVGNSSLSNVLNATIMTEPGAPTFLMADASQESITLNWTAPAYDGSSPITGYLVYRGATANAVVLIGNCTTTTYVDTTVVDGSSYYYKVSAVNAIGEGEQSAAVTTLVPWPELVPVTGTVVDADGNGLAGVTVSLENGTSVQTDENGDFVIMASQGVHTITVSGNGIDIRDLAINVDGPGLDMDEISTTEDEDGNGGMDMMIVLLIIIIVVVLLLVVVLYLRNKKK